MRRALASLILSCAGLVAHPLRADVGQALAALAPAYTADLPRLRALHAEAANRKDAAVAVLADYGVWSGSAKALADALRGGGTRVRVIDRTDMNAAGLAPVKLLILPGGFAPFQWQGVGPLGLGALEKWVRGGGRLLGLCAGAYLVSREVRYDGATYPYPLALFDGVAEGPVAGLAAFPTVGPVKITITKEGRARGLEPLGRATLSYGGGPRFVGGTYVRVLATYPDGTAALIARAHGKGEVVLSGAHVEFAPGASPWSAVTHPQAGELVRALAAPLP